MFYIATSPIFIDIGCVMGVIIINNSCRENGGYAHSLVDRNDKRCRKFTLSDYT